MFGLQSVAIFRVQTLKDIYTVCLFVSKFSVMLFRDESIKFLLAVVLAVIASFTGRLLISAEKTFIIFSLIY
jgi:hypothetical protein